MTTDSGIQLEIRPLEPAMIDRAVEAVCDLPLLQRYGWTPRQLASGLSATLQDPTSQVQVALASQQPGPCRPSQQSQRCAGLAWYATVGTFLLGGYLKLLAVAEPYQRMGVGRALLADVERIVSAHSALMFILVSDFNHAAVRFYESLGYVRAGKLDGLVLPDVAEFIYLKRLNPDQQKGATATTATTD